MWYVVQVRTGTEENIQLQCRRNISPAVLERCFIPYYEEMKRIRGTWTVQKKILFPGYFFVVSPDTEKLTEALRNVIGLTKLLGVGQDVIPLTNEETAFLQKFGGDDQVVGMSLGIIEGDTTIVQSGPLKGMEECIKKIDRHKRKAYLQLPMFGKEQLIQVGLEIMSKEE